VWSLANRFSGDCSQPAHDDLQATEMEIQAMGKVFGGMAASLDGYIASKDGDLSWLNQAMSADEDYGFVASMERSGAYIIGANTFREMMNSGMSGSDMTKTYVVTHQSSLGEVGTNVSLYSGDLRLLVEKIKAETDKDICLYGGASLVTQFIELDLVDELGISIIPVLLGDGVPFFGNLSNWKRLTLFECKPYKSGIVLLNYRLLRSSLT
jgi:dihydrofolate reductase